MENPDPSCPGEIARVQMIIDERLGNHSLLPLEDVDNLIQAAHATPDERCFTASTSSDVSFHDYLAAEKAASVDMQRPAIRKLGAAQLKKLVLAVLENVDTPEKSEGQLAGEFGLSKAALSRFAGGRWSAAEGSGTAEIPDLWKNAAGRCWPVTLCLLTSLRMRESL